MLEFGIDTFGDVTQDEATGELKSHAQVIRDVVDEAVLADELGVDAITLGEHHRADFAISSPETVLAAIAARTSHIRLGSGVTVLSSDDPVRVFERFSEVDAISGGRADIILGRGSFTESFPLYGYDMHDYEQLFNEKLEMFAEILASNGRPFTWSGTKFTQRIKSTTLYPPTEHGGPRAWIGVGGSPESVIRAARFRMPLMLAIIGGPAVRFRPFVDLYLQAWEQFGNEGEPVIGYHSPGYLAPDDDEAASTFYEYWSETNARIGAERGWRPPTEAAYRHEIAHGALMVGSPESVARKIAGNVKALGVSRFDLKYSDGRLSHEKLMDSIRLYAEEVIPRVREYVADPAFPAAQ